MLKRTRGIALLLCLLCAAGCSSAEGEVHTDVPGGESTRLAKYSDTLTALEAEMAQVAVKRAWSGAYFNASRVDGAVVNGEDLFVWVFNGANRHTEVHCINAKDGVRRWMIDVGANRLEYAPMAGERFVVCLLANGKGMVVVNRLNGARPYRMRAGLGIIPTSSAASSDSSVYIASLVDEKLHACSPDTGFSGWSYASGAHITSGPLVTPSLPRRLVVIAVDGGQVLALPPNGWTETRPSDPAWDRVLHGDVSGPLSVASGMSGGRLAVSVLAPCEDHGLYCLDAATGEPRWVHRTEAPFTGRAVALGGRVFARNSRRLFCLDLATGDPAWAASDEDGSLLPHESLGRAYVADDMRAYLSSSGKNVVRCDGKTGAILATAPLNSFAWILSTGDNNLLLGVTIDGHLVAYY
ncbi:MAG: hypothetical protein CMJ83_12020 [Planctomycetes bacterium]|nr:hypothetical protein [Planctomycetota bacterium]